MNFKDFGSQFPSRKLLADGSISWAYALRFIDKKTLFDLFKKFNLTSPFFEIPKKSLESTK